MKNASKLNVCSIKTINVFYFPSLHKKSFKCNGIQNRTGMKHNWHLLETTFFLINAKTKQIYVKFMWKWNSAWTVQYF